MLRDIKNSMYCKSLLSFCLYIVYAHFVKAGLHDHIYVKFASHFLCDHRM